MYLNIRHIAIITMSLGMAFSSAVAQERSETPRRLPSEELLPDGEEVQYVITAAGDTLTREEALSLPLNDDWQRHVYVKSDVLAWTLLLANVQGELTVRPNMSVVVPVYYSAWNYFKSTLKFRMLAVLPEYRYWLGGSDEGWYAGAHVGLAWYNYAFDGKVRTQDRNGGRPAFGGGLNAGWRMPLRKGSPWKVEFSLGLGVYSLDYDKFENRHNGPLLYSRKKAWFGIDQLSVTFSYMFNIKDWRK